MTDTEALTKFLEAWKAQNWAAMASLTQLTWRARHADPAVWLEEAYGHKLLAGFEIETSQAISPSASRVSVAVKYKLASSKGFGRSPLRTKQIDVMVICESAAYQPTPTGQWGINPISALRERTKRTAGKARNLSAK
jgi:hypothetical protein